MVKLISSHCPTSPYPYVDLKLSFVEPFYTVTCFSPVLSFRFVFGVRVDILIHTNSGIWPLAVDIRFNLVWWKRQLGKHLVVLWVVFSHILQHFIHWVAPFMLFWVTEYRSFAWSLQRAQTSSQSSFLSAKVLITALTIYKFRMPIEARRNPTQNEFSSYLPWRRVHPQFWHFSKMFVPVASQSLVLPLHKLWNLEYVTSNCFQAVSVMELTHERRYIAADVAKDSNSMVIWCRNCNITCFLALFWCYSTNCSFHIWWRSFAFSFWFEHLF